MIHPTARVELGATVGVDTNIWDNSHVRAGAHVGKNCVLGRNVFIDAGVPIGDNVKIQNNVSVYHGVVVEDGVFLGPHVVFTNDMQPRSINPDGSLKSADDWKLTPTLVKHGASIGANSVIRCGVTIGQWAMVGAGSVVTKSVPDYALVYGNPARQPILKAWVCPCGARVQHPGRRCHTCAVAAFDSTEFKKSVAEGRMTEEAFVQQYNKTFEDVGIFDYTATNLDIFQDWVGKGPVLDVGCGNGQTIKKLGREVSYGIDISPVAIAEAVKDFPNAIFAVVNAESDWQWFKERYGMQTVICGHSFEHFLRPDLVRDNIKQVCAPGATVIILIPLQGEDQKWKKTNLHVNFWPTCEAFETFWGHPAEKKVVARDGTLGVMCFKEP